MNIIRGKSDLKKQNLQTAQAQVAIPDMAVEVIDVIRTYHVGGSDVMALRGVNLQIKPGAWIGVKGRSGSGRRLMSFKRE